MHHVYIWVRKDPKQTWTTVPFIAIDDIVSSVLNTWPPEWHGLDTVGHDETAIQNLKAAAKFLA